VLRENEWRGNKQFEGVVAVCTRGALLTEVLAGILSNIMPRILGGRYWTIRTTFKDPIPDAQNLVTEEALTLNPQFIWYVEEDTVPPAGVLTQMIHKSSEVVVTDYLLEGGKQMSIHREGEAVPYSGMGCMLVNRTVFNKIQKPWFECGAWTWTGSGFSEHSFSLSGHQDVGFFVKLYEADIHAVALPEGWRCRHLRLEELGGRNTDRGLHKIREIK